MVTDDDYRTFTTTRLGNQLRVAFDNPPINLFDANTVADCERLLDVLRADQDVRVVVFSSKHPDFFLGHSDLNAFLEPVDQVPPRPVDLTPLQRMFEKLRTLPQATIAVLESRAVGAAVEFLTSCDMCFAPAESAVLAMFEVGVGVLPGATGSQRLPRVMGRPRALEFILGCQDIDAALAERYGLVNRAVTQDDLWPAVDELASRIASFPATAIASAKRAVDAAELPLPMGLLEESDAVGRTLVSGEGQRRMAELLDRGAQSAEFEREGFAQVLPDLDSPQR